MELSKEELEEEIQSIKDVLVAHEAQLKLNTRAIKAMGFIKGLLEKELEKFK